MEIIEHIDWGDLLPLALIVIGLLYLWNRWIMGKRFINCSECPYAESKCRCDKV